MKDLIIFGSEDGNVYYYDTKENAWDDLCSLEAPILAPIYTDNENGVIYVHAQNGEHILYAIDVEAPNEPIWKYTTD